MTTRIQDVSAGTVTTAQTLNVAIVTTAGNLLAASIQIGGAITDTVIGVTDTAGNTWIKAINTTSQAQGWRDEIWYCENALAVTQVTVTTNVATTRIAANVSEYSGVALSGALAQTGQLTANNTSGSSGTATPTEVGTLVIGNLGWAGSTATATLTSAGWTALSNATAQPGAAQRNGRTAYIINPALSVQEATWTLSGSVNHGGCIAVFRQDIVPATATGSISATNTATATIDETTTLTITLSTED